MTVLRRSRRLPCDHTYVHLVGVTPGEVFVKRCGTCHTRYAGRLVPLLLTAAGDAYYKVEWEAQP